MTQPIDGQTVRIDPASESDDPDLPAFIAPPKGAPSYYGFPILDESEIEGFAFGAITDPNRDGDEQAQWGDAYVIAPNGSRAGIVWQAGTGQPHAVCAPSPGRWGVYGFYFSRPIRCDDDLIECLHSVLPELKAFYAAASASCPESTKAFPPQGEA